jgi:hypothetical protein
VERKKNQLKAIAFISTYFDLLPYLGKPALDVDRGFVTERKTPSGERLVLCNLANKFYNFLFTFQMDVALIWYNECMFVAN